jgi:hypothetical protein
MTRSFCTFTLNQVIKESLPALRTLARVGIRSNFHRSTLWRVRDVLSNACNTFDEDEATGYFEAEYLACFDALACVSEALIRHARGLDYHHYLRNAFQSLEHIEESTALV